MCNRFYYCYRNEVRLHTDQIKALLETNKNNYTLQATDCMKLCMICEQRHLLVVNDELCVAKETNELLECILQKVDQPDPI